MKNVIALLAVAGLAGAANAQFVATGPGPYASDGPLGSAGNGSFTAVYGGPSTIFGSVTVSGDLTSGDVGSWLSEARWNLQNQTSGAGASVQLSTTQNTWAGTVNLSGSFSILSWANTGDTYRFESFESFNDTGVDASWTNVSMTFNPLAGIIDLGTLGAGDFNFNTFGSGFDTEIALYTSGGTLLASNDDSGAGLQSQILSTLGDGSYYLLVGGYNSGFVNGAAAPGAASGTYVLNVNDSVYGGELATNSFAVYSFTIPTPGALALLGLGGLVAARRRR